LLLELVALCDELMCVCHGCRREGHSTSSVVERSAGRKKKKKN